MQVIYKLRKTFVELLIIGLVIQCLIVLPFPSHQGTPSVSEVGNSFQSVVTNGYEDCKSRRNGVNEEIVGRVSRQGPKIWDQWGTWSSCSVTCGIGKIARWRHCIAGSCSVGEKKAQLKTCTLAAC